MSPHLFIAASYEESYGYGQFTNTIIRHLLSEGIKVSLYPMFGHAPPVDLMPYIIKKPVKNFDVMFTSISNKPSDIDAKILMTMSETIDLPWEYGHALKHHKHLIVPSEYSRTAAAKWHNSIHLCPLGTTMAYKPPSFHPFTFTAVAQDHQCPERKRIQELVDTFSATFPIEHDVRLQLKRSTNCRPIVTFDRRIEVVTARLSRTDYDELIAKATIGVQPSLMEGWSLPVNEFMAVGRPVITAMAGAVGDYLTPRAAFIVDYKLTKTPKSVYLEHGKIPYADMAQIGQQMRFAYENPFEVIRRGVAAHEASAKYTNHTMGQRFLKLCRTLI